MAVNDELVHAEPTTDGSFGLRSLSAPTTFGVVGMQALALIRVARQPDAIHLRVEVPAEEAAAQRRREGRAFSHRDASGFTRYTTSSLPTP